MRRKVLERLLIVSLAAVALGACGGTAATPGDGAAVPACTTIEGGPAMAAATFCQIFIASCPLSVEGYKSMSECVASYTGLTTTKPVRQACQSYHLCQAVESDVGANRDNHCGHATGFTGNQACEQPY